MRVCVCVQEREREKETEKYAICDGKTEVHLVFACCVRLKRDSELIKQFNGNFSLRIKIGH